jgi:hypothetical protein
MCYPQIQIFHKSEFEKKSCLNICSYPQWENIVQINFLGNTKSKLEPWEKI